MKRLLSMLMVLVMLISLLPTKAFAAEGDAEGMDIEATVVTEPVGEPETAAEPEPVDEPETAAEPELVEEPEIAGEPKLVEEPESAAEPELVEEPEPAVEPEPVGEPETAAEPKLVDETKTAGEPEPVPAEKVCEAGCILAEAHEGECYVCEEGCILEGEEEHLENGGECFVWIPCAATEGCEGPDGHEGECYGAALFADETLPIHFFLASPGNITNPNGSYVNYYGPAGSAKNWDGANTIPGIKESASWSTMYTQTGIRNVTNEGIVTQYIGSYPHGHSAASFKDFGSVTINGTTYYDTEYEIKWVSIMCRDNAHSSSGMHCQQYSFQGEHIHVDGLLVKKVEPGQMLIYKAIPESGISETTNMTFQFKLEKMQQSSLTSPPTSASAVDTSFAPLTLTATIPAGSTEAQIIGGSRITFGYYKLTELSNQDWRMAGIALTNGSGQTQTVEADALYICIAPNGTVQYSTAPSGPYTVMSRVAVQNERKPATVTYEWKVYHTDGTYTNLPAGAPEEPAAAEGVKVGSQYVYDTEYVTGTSFYDYDAGLLYSFHGWDTYSHSAAYNPIPSSGYYALDDGDASAANNPTIEITADTYIYGYWTVSELEPSSAHIAIEKIFVVDGVEMPMEAAEDLWFRVNTGYDGDSDGSTIIDVDYPMMAATGEYKIPVYQYDSPFVFTEHNAEVPGYTRTTTIRVGGEYIKDYSTNGDSVTVTMQPEYQGENVHLGTVTYTNSYTKNVGTPIHVYPVLTIMKSAADTRAPQDGADFTLYSDEACTDALATVTTANGGVAQINFADGAIAAPGTYYLKETTAPAGYHADPYVYAITLAASQSVEELRNGEFVQVTYYTLSVAVVEGSAATFTEETNRLYIYDEPILGSLELSKEISGMETADQSKLRAVVIVHGPISRDNGGNITDIGATWQLELNSEDGWAASLEGLPLGEYLIHESFASVHGYTWTDVTYGTLDTTEYNDITSGVFKVEEEATIELAIANTYEKWTAADFYIKKVSNTGAALAGATFRLYADEACTTPAAGIATTGADGYAYFSGFTVPEGQESATYYLKETKAPAGYYLSDQIYKIVIRAVTANGKTTYEPEISLVAGRNTGFDISTDLLTVVNYPVKGELTITKAFENGLIPEGLTGIRVQIGGSNGYSRVVELGSSNSWSVTLTDLALGEYTITELDAKVPGYTWNVAYSNTTVTLSEDNPGLTVPGAEINGAATITNSYVRNEKIYEVPVALTVKKVGENGEPLADAVFRIDRMGADGNVLTSVSFTTGASGTVVFDLLTGFIQDGTPIDGTYILAETKAPEGYEATSDTWTVTVKEDNGTIRWTLNENKNIFEGFWDWVVGNVSAGSFRDGVLTVQNMRKRGSLYIAKEVTDPEGLYANAEYSFTLDCSDDAFDKTFTLKADENITIEDIPWGTTYTLTENTTGAAYTSAITDEGNGLIWEYENRIIVSNTYKYTTHNHGLKLLKIDADDNTKVISGAGFTLYADAELTTKVGQEVFSDENGMLVLPIETAGTYYLMETTAPEGYHPNPAVYVVTAEEKAVVKNAGTADAVTEIQMHIRTAGVSGSSTNQIDYTYAIENTAIKAVVVKVEKVWEDDDYYARPDFVDVTLYRNNESFETITLNEGNNWRYAWTDLTDAYVWSVDEAETPSEYVKSVTNEGDVWTITNTRTPNPLEITVTKAWKHNGGKNLPESIEVTLYKNEEVYETVVLSADNQWTHTWAELNDAAQWRVDETNVPAGYTKEITVDGYDFVITNTRTINPVEVHVTKVWVASEGVIHPESVEAVLYRDGEAYKTVVLNERNDWSHTWKNLTDEYTWSVDEKTVPAGYTKNVTNDGYNFTITNTKAFEYINVSAKKVWYGADVIHPASVKVTLYRDGSAYDTVTLSAANNWSYTWENLTDEFVWNVDEPSVPSGYNKTVRRNGNSFTITNTHEDNPKTGDFNNLLGMGAMAAVGVIGFGVSALALLKPRKEEEENQ